MEIAWAVKSGRLGFESYPYETLVNGLKALSESQFLPLEKYTISPHRVVVKNKGTMVFDVPGTEQITQQVVIVVIIFPSWQNSKDCHGLTVHVDGSP